MKTEIAEDVQESIKHRCNNSFFFAEKTKPNPRNAKADREKVLRRWTVEDHQTKLHDKDLTLSDEV